MGNVSDRNKMIIAGVAAIVVLLIGFIVLRGGDDEVAGPEIETVPEEGGVIALDPMLSAITAPVDYRVTETDPLSSLEPGTSVEIAPGANIVVGENGVGQLTWPGFLENELLTGADTLLSLSLPAEFEAILDQAAGTAVYRALDFGLEEDGVQRSGQGHRLQVIAGWVTVDVVEAPSEIIVSFIPGDAPSAWVVARSGSATVTRCADDDPTDCETVEIPAGQAAAFTEDGPLPEPQDIDPSRVGAWLDQVRAGTATGSIASVAFRCVVIVDTTLLDFPDEDAEPAGELAAGTAVAARERDETGDWVLVQALLGGDEGWMAAADLDCVGPIDNLPVAVVEGEPTNTPVPLPTRAPLIIATPMPTGTMIATPTATATVEASISFTASKTEITAGECVTLKWSVENIKAVFFKGGGVTGTGERKECPTSDTTYTLKVELLDGGVEEKSITIKVRAAVATNTPAPTNTAPPPPEATPFPSNTPPPTAEPTDEPTPEPPDDPTPDPGITVPSSPPAAEGLTGPSDTTPDAPGAASR